MEKAKNISKHTTKIVRNLAILFKNNRKRQKKRQKSKTNVLTIINLDTLVKIALSSISNFLIIETIHQTFKAKT